MEQHPERANRWADDRGEPAAPERIRLNDGYDNLRDRIQNLEAELEQAKNLQRITEACRKDAEQELEQVRQQVEQLCGDLKAIQHDYTNAAKRNRELEQELVTLRESPW